jgi:hypothetical protein|tara:strand:- start:9146 stop:9511 length:366 start_codon:yes stop_codon:yes gene_type:complete
MYLTPSPRFRAATDRHDSGPRLPKTLEGALGGIRAELHPDDYPRFKRKLDAEVAALGKRAAYINHTNPPDRTGLRYDRYAAPAFLGLVTSTRAAAKTVPEVSVLIDLDTLRSGTHADSTCE